MSEARTFVVNCPSCQTALKVKTRSESKTVVCPKCATPLVAGEPPRMAAAAIPPATAADPCLEVDEPIVAAPALQAPGVAQGLSEMAPVAPAIPVAAFAPPLAAAAGAASAITATPPLPRARQWMDRAQAYIDRGGQATGLEPGTFAAVALGLGASTLLLIVTCFTWYTLAMDMRLFGTPLSEGESHRGISYLEGKLAFIGALSVGVWVGLGISRKSWLPGALLAAGAVHTFATVILLGLRSQLAAAFAGVQREQAELARFISGNPFTKPLESVSKDTGSTLLPILSGGVGWALVLAILLTLTAAAAFAVASRRRPLAVAFFEKPGTAPLVQRYGTLAAANGLAFLLGVMVVVIRH